MKSSGAERRQDRRRGKTVTYVLLSVWAVIVLFPFYWMVLTSVKSYGAIQCRVHSAVLYAVIRPLQNYADAFTAVPLGRYLLNTLIFTVITTALMMIVITAGGLSPSRG